MRHTNPRGRASALTGALLALSLMAGCGEEDATPTAGDPASTSSSEATSAGDPSTSATSSPGAGSGATEAPEAGAVPVYYVGDTPQGDRLFREFNSVAGADPLVAAAGLVTSGDPVDPDYRTLWPGGRFASVTRESDAIVVELPDDGWLAAGDLDAEQARLAVQQLVYSLQGAAGERLPVRPVLDGEPAPTLLGVDAGSGLTATPELDVLAMVNVTEPAEGAVVSSGTLLAHGRASSFEANVPWEIQDATGQVVLRGFATAEGWMDKLHPWETTIKVGSLPAGDYTFVARTDDPSDGEGFGPTEDTKRFTVQ